MITALRYRTPYSKEIVAILTDASTTLDAIGVNRNLPTINAVAQPATTDAKRNFQTAAISGAIPRSIGLPA